MPLRKRKPTSAGRRFQSVADFSEITRTEPEKSLVEPLKKTGGRDNHGHIAMRRRGGGHKRKYRIIDFRRDKFGIAATVHVEESADGPRFNIIGDEAELLVRHRGEPLRALQHIVDSSYGRGLEGDKRVFIDALEYRKGKDIELRQMAKFLAQKAKDSGLDQQLGPLNPYERRIVHMAVAEVPGVTTESIGDAFSKTVHISKK